MSTVATDRWPTEEVFQVRDPATLKRIRSAPGEWLGVYVARPFGKPLCASQSAVELRRKLSRIPTTFPVWICRAQSKAELTRAPQPWENDWFSKRCSAALWTVIEACRLANDRRDASSLRPGTIALRQQRIVCAAKFLRQMKYAINPPGKVGPPILEENTSSTIALIARIVKGETIKQSVRGGSESRAQVQRGVIRTFCDRAYQSLCETYPSCLSRDFPHLVSPDFVTDPMMEKVFEDWPGASFPEHLPVFRWSVNRAFSRAKRRSLSSQKMLPAHAV
jgi:hypothetical protein